MLGLRFNPQQKKGIAHERGPMLVVAGAGTGKTAVLTERVARLIERRLAKPGEVLALTYTINAAAELKARVEQRVGAGRCGDLRAANFHSYCFGLLQEHGRAFHVLDDYDLMVWLRNRLHELPLELFRKAADPGRFLKDLTDFFKRCSDELVTPARYARYVEDVKAGRQPLPRVSASREVPELKPEEILARCEEISAVYAKVEAMLAERDLGTFGKQITGAVGLLRSDPAVLAAERARARFILVDEFQDCNQAQIELVRLLAGDEQNVFAVGDPDQAIYRFRGATSGAFDSFRRAFGEVQHLTLAENYRSTSPILGCAYHVIAENPLVPSAAQLQLQRAPLRSARDQAEDGGGALPSPTAVVLHTGGLHEAIEVAADIAERRARTGARWSDFCVLYRMASHRDELVRVLHERGTPFVVEGLDALDTTEVRDLLAALRALVWPAESIPLLRLAARPEFRLDGAGLRAQLAAAKRDTPLVALLEKSPGGKKLLATIAEMGRLMPPAGTAAGTYIAAVIRRFGFDRASRPLQAFLAFVDKWQGKPIGGQGNIAEFLDYLELFREFGGTVPLEPRDDEDAVRLMTAHAAKGREFRHVYVLRASTHSFPLAYKEVLFEFPHALRHDAAGPERDAKTLQAEEERRLFYVAMTRAQDSLTLLARKDRFGKPLPSGYLRDLSKWPDARPLWSQRDAAPVTVDIAAQAGALPQVSAVAPWVLLPVRPEVKAMALSASAIETYDACPLRFKFRYDWRLPEEPGAALQFGAAMHTVLKEYFDQVKLDCTPKDEAVIARFREEFARLPVEDPLQRTLYERDGVRQLTDFLAARRAAPPVAVLSTETSFRVPIAGVTVTGRIDRLDRAGEGAADVIDYKTGKPRDQKNADGSLQLSIYALAVPLQWGLRPQRLVFYNLVTNEAVATRRTPEKLQATEEKVRAVAANIAAGNFDPDPGYHCRWCGYRDLCPATEERAEPPQQTLQATGVN